MRLEDSMAALRAEFTKIRSSRGALIAAIAFAGISIGVAALDGWSARRAIVTHSHLLRSGFTPQQAGLDGVLYGQVALIALGVLVVTSEYGSGMIRLSLLAVPNRARFIAAKMAALTVAAIAVAVPVTIVSYATTQLALGRYGTSLSAPGVPRALAGAVAYLVLMSLFAAGIAAMTRSPIVPLVILIPMVLVGSHILSIIGATKAIARYFPDQAGNQMLTVHVPAGQLSPIAGFAILLAWAAASQLGGYVLHSVRDV